MKTHHKSFILTLAVVVFMGLLGVFLLGRGNAGGDKKVAENSEGDVAGATTIGGDDYLANLAKSLRDQGAVLYGSYLSPETNEQKEMFKESASTLDYVECDAAGPDANPDECIAQKIETYPTWVFEGTQYKDVQELSTLAQMIGFSE
jgi:hypothetical protein